MFVFHDMVLKGEIVRSDHQDATAVIAEGGY